MTTARGTESRSEPRATTYSLRVVDMICEYVHFMFHLWNFACMGCDNLTLLEWICAASVKRRDRCKLS